MKAGSNKSVIGKAKKDDDIVIDGIPVDNTNEDFSTRDEISTLEFQEDDLDEVSVQKPGPLQRASRGVARNASDDPAEREAVD